jgi:hypothetical protein
MSALTSRSDLRPTETTEERYRSRAERDQRGDCILHILTYFSRAKCIWLYGLSLDPADAELSMIIQAALNEPATETRRITISARRCDLPRIRRRVDAIVAMSQMPADITEDSVYVDDR